MTDPTRTRRIWRGIGAVAAGFVTTFALSVGGDVVLHATDVFPPWGQPMTTSLFVLALAYRTVFTVLGGFVTAKLAPDRPMRHGWILAGVGTLGGIGGVVAWAMGGPELGPAWYPIALAVLAVPSVIAGARLGR
jgi:hypothetical protein